MPIASSCGAQSTMFAAAARPPPSRPPPGASGVASAKAGCSARVDHGPGEDGAAPGGWLPRPGEGVALRADLARHVAERPAIRAALEAQLALPAPGVELGREALQRRQRLVVGNRLLAHRCRSSLAPQDRDAAVAEVAPAGDHADLGIGHLARAGVAAQLLARPRRCGRCRASAPPTSRPPCVLTGSAPPSSMRAVLDEGAALAAPAEAEPPRSAGSPRR